MGISSSLETARETIRHKEMDIARTEKRWQRKLEKAVEELKRGPDSSRARAIARRIATIRLATLKCQTMLSQLDALALEIDLVDHAQSHTDVIQQVTSTIATLSFDDSLLSDYRSETLYLETLHDKLAEQVGDKTKTDREEETQRILDEYGVLNAPPTAPIRMPVVDDLEERLKALSA